MAQGSRARGRIFIFLALIIILVLVLVYVVYIRNNSAGRTSTAPLPTATIETTMVDIVVTSQHIPQGATITADVLSLIKYPLKEAPNGLFFNKMDDVVGKAAKIDIDPQVPLTHNLVVDISEGSLKSIEIPKGMVAVSIPVKDRISFVSFLPQAGDHVSVIASLLYLDLDTNFQTELPNLTASVTAPGPASDKSPAGLTAVITAGGAQQGRAELDPTLNQPIYLVPSEKTSRPRMVSQTLLADARILQVGNFTKPAPVQPQATGPTPTPAPGSTPAPSVSAVVLPDIITLIVTPQDAVTLNYLVYSGAQLSLALRGAGDDQRVQTEAVTLQYLMDQYNIPLPTKLPYGFEPRVDVLKLPDNYTITNTSK